MTAATLTTGDLIREFLHDLTPAARTAIIEHRNGIEAIDATRTILISTAALDHGWTPAELAAECSRNLAGVYRPAGLITDRLRRCADGRTGRPVARGPAKFHQPLDWCGLCDGPYTRRREDPETGRLLGRCDCWTEPS